MVYVYSTVTLLADLIDLSRPAGLLELVGLSGLVGLPGLIGLSGLINLPCLKGLAWLAGIFKTTALFKQFSFQGVSGRMVGKSMTSLIELESVSSITSRSIPIPRPPVGGIPYSRART